MNAPSRFLVAAALVLPVAAACSGDSPLGPPRPESMLPSTTTVGTELPATIAGEGFFVDASVSYTDEDRSDVDSRFSAFLGTAELLSVTRVDSHSLEVVVPGTLPIGVYDLTVVDPRGREGVLLAAFEVLVAPCLMVTTSADEANVVESPEPPHLGAGLSLREAIGIANARTGEVCIEFAQPMTITLADALPAFSGSAAIDIDGTGDVTLNGTAVSSAAIGLDFTAPNARVAGLRIEGFDDSPGIGVRLSGASVIEDCDLTTSRTGAFLAGPDNRVTGSRITEHLTAGVQVRGADSVIEDSRITDCLLSGLSVEVGGDRTGIYRNVLIRNGSGVAINSASDVRIDHNTLADGGVGVTALSNVTGARVRNSIITGMSGRALAGNDVELSEVDYVLFFGNNNSPCSACTIGPNCPTTDPLYVDPGNDDFSIGAGSPAIDAGVDTGLDVNGATPGLFNGVAPDLGGMESP